MHIQHGVMLAVAFAFQTAAAFIKVDPGFVRFFFAEDSAFWAFFNYRANFAILAEPWIDQNYTHIVFRATLWRSRSFPLDCPHDVLIHLIAHALASHLAPAHAGDDVVINNKTTFGARKLKICRKELHL